MRRVAVMRVVVMVPVRPMGMVPVVVMVIVMPVVPVSPANTQANANFVKTNEWATERSDKIEVLHNTALIFCRVGCTRPCLLSVCKPRCAAYHFA